MIHFLAIVFVYVQIFFDNNNNNNNTLIYIAPACRMTSEALICSNFTVTFNTCLFEFGS